MWAEPHAEQTEARPRTEEPKQAKAYRITAETVFGTKSGTVQLQSN
jgi:hypothetical protein